MKLLGEIDAYLRNADEAVRQVSVSLASQWQVVEILRADGRLVRDVRPLVRLNVSVVAGRGERQETGSGGAGGRHDFLRLMEGGNWRSLADEALRQARLNLEALPAPAGTFDTVLASGWPGVMLHEAVGHGLEGDYNRKKTSAFSGLLGHRSPRAASRWWTTARSRSDAAPLGRRRGNADQPHRPHRGRQARELHAGSPERALMGMQPTGNGRRQSFAHAPMPRMTNTMMLDGPHSPEEILASVKDGIYAVSFNGGQVDITSGKFVFNCTEAYRIREGKVCEPLKGVMLIGNGPDAMHRVSMVGNDAALDLGIGNCGKAGQWVPVGVGQPHLRMDQMTVGGTERDAAPSPSRIKPLDRPFAVACRLHEAEAVVEAELAVLPELDLDRHDPEARPVRRTRNGVSVFRLDLGDLTLQHLAAGERAALLRRPRADLATVRAASK